MTFHLVQVYSFKPWVVSADFELMSCENKMLVEAIEDAAQRGKCVKGHVVDLVSASANPNFKAEEAEWRKRHRMKVEGSTLVRKGFTTIREVKA